MILYITFRYLDIKKNSKYLSHILIIYRKVTKIDLDSTIRIIYYLKM